MNSAVWNDHLLKSVCKCSVDCKVLGTKGISAENQMGYKWTNCKGTGFSDLLLVFSDILEGHVYKDCDI